MREIPLKFGLAELVEISLVQVKVACDLWMFTSLPLVKGCVSGILASNDASHAF